MKRSDVEAAIVPHPAWRQLAHLSRWQVVRCELPRSVASHCFYVCLYAEHLIRLLELDTEDAFTLLRACINHDLAESITGDVPTPVKRWMGWDDAKADELVENLTGAVLQVPLSPHLKYFLKIVDQLEAVVHLTSERNNGNAHVLTPLAELRGILMTVAHNAPPEAISSWETHYGRPWPTDIQWWVNATLSKEDQWRGTSFANSNPDSLKVVEVQ